MDKVKKQMSEKSAKKSSAKPKPALEDKNKGMVVIPYVAGLSEKVSRVLKKHNISTAMKPHTTIRNILVHPKDKQEKRGTPNVVYEIPCNSCPFSYVGETKRLLGVRLDEHKNEAEKAGAITYTRAKRKTSLTELNKSAITDHVAMKNHVIGWEDTEILERESNLNNRRVREAIWIRKRGQDTMNRDEGVIQLSHVYDPLLANSGKSKPTTSGSTTSGKVSRRLDGSSQRKF